MFTLNNKKILLICPFFFCYENAIKTAYEKNGATVFLYNEKKHDTAVFKSASKIFPRTISFFSRNYYLKIINSHDFNMFDYILVIRGSLIDDFIANKIKERFPKARLCLYLWDSIKNVKCLKNRLKNYDFISSFDLNDSNSYKGRILFRPLFFANEENVNERVTFKHDLLFYGTIHSDRYYIIKKIENGLVNSKIRFYKYMFLPARFMFLFYKIFGKGFRCAKAKDFSYDKKSFNDISNLVEHSKVILDINHPKQSGLTIRTIESLVNRKKIITTNKSILHYDLYNPKNVCIIDRKKPTIDTSFFIEDFVEIDKSIIDYYNINKWIIDVIGERQ